MAEEKNSNPDPQGIWLEIEEIEYDSKYPPGNEAAIVARFKADLDPREPTWYQVGLSDSRKASEEYDRFLKWLDKGRILLGRLGCDNGKLCIIAIRTKTPKSDD